MTKSATREAADEVSAPVASPVFTGTTTTNLLASNGTILGLQTNGTSVGSIGTLGGATYFGSADSGIMFNGVNQNPTNGTSTRVDNTNDLGAASYRYKDIYLGGGAFLGGTATANKLDDYEEGTWTPVITSTTPPTVTYSGRHASYTKVGQVVTWNLSIQWSAVSGGSGTLRVTLPFTANATGGWQGGQNMSYAGGINVAIRGSGYAETNQAYFYIGLASDNASNAAISNMNSTGHLIAGGTFQTNS